MFELRISNYIVTFKCCLKLLFFCFYLYYSRTDDPATTSTLNSLVIADVICLTNTVFKHMSFPGIVYTCHKLFLCVHLEMK